MIHGMKSMMGIWTAFLLAVRPEAALYERRRDKP